MHVAMGVLGNENEIALRIDKARVKRLMVLTSHERKSLVRHVLLLSLIVGDMRREATGVV